MKRFFRKKPPPGWEPPKLIAPPKPSDARATLNARIEQWNDTVSAAAARRSTHTPPWSAVAPTDTSPWTAQDGADG